jgi:hypothetical protein
MMMHKNKRTSKSNKGDFSGPLQVITLNWGQVIRSAELLESEMVVFFFKEQEDNFLCLNMFIGIAAYP